jgi:ABC-type transport system involved in Fe-S cluster assembly fused permease/ATPase subunit
MTKSAISFLDLLIDHLGRNKFKILLLLSVVAVSKVTLLVVPFSFASLVNQLAGEKNLVDTLTIGITALIAMYCSLTVIGIALQELKEYFSTKLISGITADIGVSIFWSAHASSRNDLLGSRLGALSRDIDRGLKGLQSIAGILTHSVIPTLVEVTVVGTYFLFQYEIHFFLVLVITITCYSIYSFYATNKWSTSRHEINQTDSDANQKLFESLMNYDLIKFFAREKYELQKYKQDLRRHADLITAAQASHSRIIIGQQIITALGLCITFLLTVEGIKNGGMTVGDLVLINGLMISICSPLAFLGLIYKDTLQSVIDVKKLNSQIKFSTYQVDKKSTESYFRLEGESYTVRFENVSFHYPGKSHGESTVRNINITLRPGTTTAIVGESGSGKSTLTRLLFRLYEPLSGRVLINETDVRELNYDELRRLISIVPQGSSLFHGSVRSNIAYGNLNATDQEIIKAAEIAQLHDLICKLPEGYETSLGERGQKFSGGEQQRISVARAILKKAPIIILDEPTSALDASIENALQSDLKESFKGKTVLIITHRLKLASDANFIYVMSKGQVVESGSHADLLSFNGHYKSQWEKQNSIT